MVPEKGLGYLTDNQMKQPPIWELIYQDAQQAVLKGFCPRPELGYWEARLYKQCLGIRIATVRKPRNCESQFYYIVTIPNHNLNAFSKDHQRDLLSKNHIRFSEALHKFFHDMLLHRILPPALPFLLDGRLSEQIVQGKKSSSSMPYPPLTQFPG